MADTNTLAESDSRRSWLVLPLLVVAHAALNLLLFPYGEKNWLEQLLIGVVLAQPILFGIWIALGTGPAVRRVPLTLASFVMVVLASGITSWNLSSRSKPLDPLPLEYLMLQLGVFASVAVAMTAARWTTGWRITCPPDLPRADSPRNQYSTRFLIGWMTVCALLLVGGRHLITGGVPGQSEYVHTAIILALLLLTLLPAMYIPLFVVSSQPRLRLLPLLFITWIALGWLAIEAFAVASAAYDIGPSDRGEITSLVVMVQTGAVAAGTASALALRWAGYRLSAVRLQSTETQTY